MIWMPVERAVCDVRHSLGVGNVMYIYVIPPVHRSTNASKTEEVMQRALKMKENEEAVKDEVILTGVSSSARSRLSAFSPDNKPCWSVQLILHIFLYISKFLQECTASPICAIRLT